MSIIALIDTTNLSSYAIKQKTVSVLKQKLMSINLQCIEINHGLALGSKLFYSYLKDNYALKYDAIFYVYGDEVLLDLDLTKEMINSFESSQPDYVFAEGYPAGLSGQIIKCSMLNDLIDLATDTEMGSVFVFDTILYKVNNFEVETFISPIDVRHLRLNFNYKTKNNYLLTNKIKELNFKNTNDLLKELAINYKLGYALPTYYQFQIVEGYQNIPNYLPSISFNNNTMDFDLFKDCLAKINNFSAEATISLSYMGEAFLHPDIAKFLEEVLKYKGLKLHLETTGQIFKDGVNNELINILKDFPYSRLSLIIYADTIREELYKTIHTGSFKTMMDFVDVCQRELPNSTYVQLTHTKETDSYVEEFYRFFKDKEIKFLILHSCNYCNTLDLEPIALIEPIKRNVCVALLREMAINVNGDVNSCRCDVFGNYKIGNVFKENVDTIWDNFLQIRDLHAKEKYPKHCVSCKEHFVFNF